MKKKIFYILFPLSVIGYSQLISTGTPQAVKATAGIGLHKSRVFWVNWDINNDKTTGDNLISADGKETKTTFTSPAGFVYNITLSDIKVYSEAGALLVSGNSNRVFNSSTSTSWNGNNMPTAYSGFSSDFIGLNQSRQVGGTLYGNGNRVTFRLTVTATDPYGVSGNASGLVIGGSESLGGPREWYTITTPQGRIRLLDKYIKDGKRDYSTSSAIWNKMSVQLQVSNNGKTIKTTNPSTTAGDSKGDVVLFAEDVPYIDCEVKGGGGQSIALGFLEELDYSDAPISYGLAYHLIENKFSGGLFSNGNTNINTNSSNLSDVEAVAIGQIARLGDPTLRLGADIDAEDQPTLPAAGANPNIDDTFGADDEDALPNTTAGFNGYYGIKYVNISPLTSYLTMWVDKDRNGTFDTTEKVTTTIPPNKSGTAIIDVTPLNLPTGSNYYTRIRYSSRANLGAIGFAPDGEVEDHFINVVKNLYNILGTVYQDNNAGSPDGVPLENITVDLLNTSGTVIATTTTNYNGSYIFSGLTAGNYTVKVTTPTSPTYQNVSSTDSSPTDGSTTVITNSNQLNVNFGMYFSQCEKPATTSVVTPGLATENGISALRTDAGLSNWPQVREGGWIALESKTKGLVINRVAAEYEAPLGDGQVPTITNPTKGMIIYDTTNKCLKIYTGTAWKCFSTQACPTN